MIYRQKLIFCLHFRYRKYWCIFNYFCVIRSESYRIQYNYAAVRAITPFKLIQGHQFWYQSKALMRLPISDYYKLTSYLTPFPSSIRPTSLYSATPLVFNSSRRRGSPGTISVKWSKQMAVVPNGIETLRKISITWVGCTNVSDDRQRDGLAMT